MEFKGTKGEWKFIRTEKGFHIETFGLTNWLIAITITNNQQDEANAKLISCATELLNFAIEMTKRYPNSEWIAKEANELILKATTI